MSYNSPQQWQFWVTRKRINPDTGIVFTEEEAKRHVSSFRKSSKYFWIKKGYTEDEAIKKVLEHQQILSQKSKSKNTGRKDWRNNQVGYWVKKGLTTQDAINKVKERQSTFSLKKCIEKYGELEGLKVFNNRQKKWQITLLCKSSKEIELINKLKQHSLESFILRNCNLDDYCKFRIQKGSDQYIIHKTKKYILENKIEQTTENFNTHYYNFKYITYKKRGKASKESLKILIPLYKFCRKLGIQRNDIMIGITGSKEFSLRDNKKIFYFDFTISSLKIIIEYNRYEFHPDPEIMSHDEIKNFKYPYKNISITSKIEHEKKKHLIAKDNGYNIIKFWSHKPYNSQIESIKKEINESYCKTNS
jgi:hypothetical protein